MMDLDLSQSHSTDIYFECRCGEAWNRTHHCVGEVGVEVSEDIVMGVARWFWKYGLSSIWSEWLLSRYSISAKYINRSLIPN